jgi:cytoskeletal protein CcmA (bactofilin family)
VSGPTRREVLKVDRSAPRMFSKPLALVAIGCLCVVIPFLVMAAPLSFGSLDEQTKEKHKEAAVLIDDLGLKIDVNDKDIVRIGSGFAVDEDETIEGDVVIIGGGLTVEGTIKGDAAVVGGSMYLASTAFVGGDAVVVGGILETEEGATVVGEIVENPEMKGMEALKVDQAKLKELQKLSDLEGLADLEDLDEIERRVEAEEGDVLRFNEDIYIARDEIVEGDVVAISGDIEIEGRVTGDVVSTAGDILVGSTAEIYGDVVATFGEVTVEPGATIEGDVAEVDLGGAHKLDVPHLGKKVPGGEQITYIVSLHRPDADDVRLTGSFIDWDPDGIEMDEDEDGTWRTTISLSPGSYKYKFIVDGVWMADPDVEQRVPDGEGGWATPLIVKPKIKTKVEGEGTSTIIFSLDRPDLDDVRVTGDWMGWDAEGERMKQDENGKWSIAVPLEPGLHAYRFYIDGEWVPDPDEPDNLIQDRYGDYATSVVVSPPKGDGVLIKFLHDRPDVRDMRIRGDFNEWSRKGEPMYKDKEGVWFTYLALTPGSHTYQFYLDGDWMADPDSPEHKVRDDELGYVTEFTVMAPKREMRMTMKTKPAEGTSFSPLFDYNRVDGCYFGAHFLNNANDFPLPRFYIEGGYSKMRDRGLYTLEIEQPLAPPFMLSVGGSIYDKTDTYDREIISDWENLLAASFVKREYRDYFDLRGITGFVAIRPFSGHMLKLAYTSDEYRPLETRAHSALARKNSDFQPNPRNSVQIGYSPEGDLLATKVDVTSLSLMYELDDRGCCPDQPTDGMWLRLMGEWAESDWGGDLDYALYAADLREYRRISTKQMVALRIKTGLMDLTDACACYGALEPQFFFPKTFYVGGIGTLPAYGFKQFQGTHMFLANVEYAYALKGALSLVFFSDAGDATGAVPTDKWDAHDLWEDLKIKFDAGVGIRHEEPGEHSFTVGVAKGLTKLYEDEDRPVILTVRATRMF